MTYLLLTLRICLFIYLLVKFNVDFSLCESDISENTFIKETDNTLEDSRNIIQRNAGKICIVLFVIAVTCMISGIIIVENASPD